MAKESSGQAVSRNQLIVLGALFVVLLGVVYFLFLKGDGSEPASDAAPAPAPVTAPEPSEDEDAEKAPAPKKKSKGPVETSEVFGGKDPFEPVVDLTPETAGGETTAATTTETSTTETTTTDTSTTPTTPTTPTVPTTPTPPPPDDDDDDDDVVKTGYSVKLLDVYDDNGTPMALVKTVNRETSTDKVHKLEAGDRFRRYFKLTSLNDRCANFLYADEPFALCVGQRTVRK